MSWGWIAYLVFLTASVGIKTVGQAHAEGTWDAVAGVVLSFLGVGLFVWLIAWIWDAQVRRFVARVAVHRPDARLVLSLTARELREEAVRVGAVRRRSRWSTFVVAAVTADSVELWAGRDSTPRWSIRREGLTLAVVPQDMTFGPSTRTFDALQATIGSTVLTLVPTPPSVVYVRKARLRIELERAISAFDREPSSVPGLVNSH